MKAGKRTNRRVIERRPIGKCYFCKNEVVPDYKNYEALAKYLTDRARIVSRDRSGVCAKHQRRLSQAIKRARHLGLLPFTGSL